MQWPTPPFPTKAAAAGAQFVQAGATANTKGVWITLLSGLTAPAAWMSLGTDRFDTVGDRAVLMDLAIGGAGSETVVVPNLLMGYRTWRSTLFPLHVPAGATLRARMSCAIGGEVVEVSPRAFLAEPDSGLSVPGRIAAYGVDTASSSGTTVTPSGTDNVKGSYAQLVASTTSPIHALMVMVQGSSSTLLNLEYLIDIAVGGAGSETVLVPDFSAITQSDERVYPRSPEFGPQSFSLPAGVRLSARCAVVNSASVIPIEVAVYGFTY